MNPWPRIAEENRPYPNTQARASALFQSVSGDLHSLADTISNEALPGPHRLDVLKRRIALITETLAQWPEDPD
ncbi:MAG: hypothetical protein HYV27_15110 [Candidatus Hydrogenedentes bacterium]|nr:hypothetical protein [Candidatus Hydrogenedentota bacterium]